MTHAETIQVIRDAVECLNRHSTYWDDKCNKALAALDTLENDPMRLPELPEDWELYGITAKIDDTFEASICHKHSGENPQAFGPTPRATVLAAIAKIEGER